jgi:hypothetical protein
MLQTINGFDLLLIIIITVLGFRVYQLNQECDSYVQKLLSIGWHGMNPYPKPTPNYGYCDYCTEAKPVELYPECTCKPEECLYCQGIEEFITGNECYCQPN